MHCPICNGESAQVGRHGSVPILQCRNSDCGFRFFDLAQWTDPYRDRDYYLDWNGALDATAPWIDARVRLVRRFMPGGTVAELGCGIGETAVAFAQAGFDVAAVDESGRAIDVLRSRYPRISWYCSRIEEFLRCAAPASFDAITMFHVLEHLPEPRTIVRLARQALRGSGILVIEVPDSRGGFARLRGPAWGYCQHHHINYFDDRSLAKLCGQAGFRLAYRQPTYHFSHPQGDLMKDAVKGALAWLGLNAIIRTVWVRR